MKYIYHHLGLGDHIICNGLVRSLINPNEEYYMFVKEHNLESVKFMYRDILNLKFIIANDDYANQILEDKKEKIIIGFKNINKNWDEFFYNQYDINFENRWDKFYVLRNNEREEKLYKKLNPNDEKYILIHNKGSDNIDRINYKLINNNFKKIFIENFTDNIFDYLTLIEKSEEIHCIESSFHLLIDSFDKINNNIFFHTKFNSRGFKHKIKNNWQIV